ncbi:RNA-binding S4 domain-containing protein [Roseovarius phycicola]|uniref:RNA-binding S4 domain-containing protein n=1 Tax=Roseovarius phycicola TaxID=3080976 RepID=A0ABZ2HPJ1_9RHOB
MSDTPETKIRLDKWLWHARFFKTRGLSAKLVSGGHVRVNRVKVSKPSHAVGSGDVLTFPQARDIRVIRIVAVSDRRGPAPEARALYEDLDPLQARPKEILPQSPQFEGKGRPTKRDRRKLDLNRPDKLE